MFVRSPGDWYQQQQGLMDTKTLSKQDQSVQSSDKIDINRL